MIIVQHRVNDVETLIKTPKNLGVEVDIRSKGEELYLAHDPFIEGTSLSKFLKLFDHPLIVLNVKEEGLEERCLDLLKQQGISNYFFLDQSMPFLIKRGLAGMKDGACRISEYESLQTVKNLAPFCRWVWVDSFSPEGVDIETLRQIKALDLKICLVSPELHGAHRIKEIEEFVYQIHSSKIEIDAVCTKLPEKWAQN